MGGCMTIAVRNHQLRSGSLVEPWIKLVMIFKAVLWDSAYQEG